MAPDRDPETVETQSGEVQPASPEDAKTAQKQAEELEDAPSKDD